MSVALLTFGGSHAAMPRRLGQAQAPKQSSGAKRRNGLQQLPPTSATAGRPRTTRPSRFIWQSMPSAWSRTVRTRAVPCIAQAIVTQAVEIPNLVALALRISISLTISFRLIVTITNALKTGAWRQQARRSQQSARTGQTARRASPKFPLISLWSARRLCRDLVNCDLTHDAP